MKRENLQEKQKRSRLLTKGRAAIRKNICTAAGVVVAVALCAGSYMFFQGNYYEDLEPLHKADRLYAAEESSDAWRCYVWAEAAQELSEKQEDILSHTRVVSMKKYLESGEISEEFYDADGNITLGIFYGKDGAESRRVEYRYDEQGNCVEELYYMDGALRNAYTYNELGNMTEAASYDAEGVVSFVQSRYEYDDNGNVLSCVETDSVGDITETCEWEYDEDGNRTAEYFYDCNGELYYWSETSYTKDGAGGSMEESLIYSYDMTSELVVMCRKKWSDADGNLIKDIAYDSEGNAERGYTWEYDENGQEIHWTKSWQGEIYEEWLYTYDERGLLTQELCYEQDGGWRALAKRVTYEYDAAGNEVKSVSVSYPDNADAEEEVCQTEYQYVYEAGE